jgi:hypothetical protein
METQFIIENAPRSAMCFKKDWIPVCMKSS